MWFLSSVSTMECLLTNSNKKSTKNNWPNSGFFYFEYEVTLSEYLGESILALPSVNIKILQPLLINQVISDSHTPRFHIKMATTNVHTNILWKNDHKSELSHIFNCPSVMKFFYFILKLTCPFIFYTNHQVDMFSRYSICYDINDFVQLTNYF